MYADFPVGRIGMIQSFMYRAARMVMDTGMHAKGWSREQSIRYFTENVGLDAISATSEVERYVVWPGQACSYKIGHNEIVRLREEARARLGDRFDIKGVPRRRAAQRRHAARSARHRGRGLDGVAAVNGVSIYPADAVAATARSNSAATNGFSTTTASPSRSRTSAGVGGDEHDRDRPAAANRLDRGDAAAAAQPDVGGDEIGAAAPRGRHRVRLGDREIDAG